MGILGYRNVYHRVPVVTTAILIKIVLMDIVEAQKPECGSLLEHTATDIVDNTLHPASSAQILDCCRNGYRRASEV